MSLDHDYCWNQIATKLTFAMVLVFELWRHWSCVWISRNREKDQTKSGANKNNDEEKTNTQVTAGKNGKILLLQFTKYKPVIALVDLLVTDFNDCQFSFVVFILFSVFFCVLYLLIFFFICVLYIIYKLITIIVIVKIVIP